MRNLKSSIALFFVIPVSAQTVSWQISVSSVAVVAAESLAVYRGAPAGLSADAVGSSTNDVIVVKAEEKDGVWSWSLLPISTGPLSFTARFKAADGSDITAPSVSFAVTSTGLADEEDISDIKAPMSARPALWPWFLAAVLGAAAWYGWHRWKNRRLAPDGTPLNQEPPLAPEIVAERAIAELRGSGLWETDQIAYYARLTDILRQYLESRYGQSVTAMTSVEVERLVKSRAQSLQTGGKVRELLARADLVKFAKAKPGAEEGPEDADLALAVIKATTPRDLAEKKR